MIVHHRWPTIGKRPLVHRHCLIVGTRQTAARIRRSCQTFHSSLTKRLRPRMKRFKSRWRNSIHDICVKLDIEHCVLQLQVNLYIIGIRLPGCSSCRRSSYRRYCTRRWRVKQTRQIASRALTREVSMSRGFKPKEKNLDISVTKQKLKKNDISSAIESGTAARKTPSDPVTLVSATPTKPRCQKSTQSVCP